MKRLSTVNIGTCSAIVTQHNGSRPVARWPRAASAFRSIATRSNSKKIKRDRVPLRMAARVAIVFISFDDVPEPRLTDS